MINPAQYKDIKRKVFETLGKADPDQILPDRVFMGSNHGRDVTICLLFEEVTMERTLLAQDIEKAEFDLVVQTVNGMFTAYNVGSAHGMFDKGGGGNA